MTIDVDQYKLYIFSNRGAYDDFGIGFPEDNVKAPKEFFIGDKKSYAVFSTDGVLLAIGNDYKYESNYLRLKSFYNFNDNYVEFNTGVYPMNDITEDTFINTYIPVLETFEY